MCSPDELQRLIKKYYNEEELSSTELRTLVEGLEQLIREPSEKTGDKIAAGYALSRIASRMDDLESSVKVYTEETRQNFSKIAQILEERKKVGAGANVSR